MKYSDVIFNEAEHTYTTPEGKKLSGITRMIDELIFGGKLSKVPESILKPYAEYGSLVHNEIDMFYTIGLTPTTPEAKKAIDTLPKCLTTEYLVNNDDFATKIDFVSGDYDLYDFKTSRVLDIESLSWQLSCCAVLFKHQNGFECGRLYGMHLRGDVCEVVEVERKTDEQILRLFEAYLSNTDYLDLTSDETALNKLHSIEEAIIRIKQEADFYEQQKQELLMFFESKMGDVKKIETDRLIITKVEPSVTKTIDSVRLKKEMPDIASAFEKITERKGYIKLKIKDGNPTS